MMTTLSNAPSQNRLLATLPPDELQRLRPFLEVMPMPVRHMLYEPNRPIEYVYFPLYGVASLITVMDDNTEVEVGTVGNEGMVGIPILLGTDRTNGRGFWQVPGAAARMTSENFRNQIQRDGPFTRMLWHYLQALFSMLAQHTACNRIHPIEQRCARWLLQTRDRVPTDEFYLTQEFLGKMLGVRRAGVNAVMQSFQQAGYLTYRRGVVTILDRAGLEAASCECYRIIKAEYDRLLGT